MNEYKEPKNDIFEIYNIGGIEGCEENATATLYKDGTLEINGNEKTPCLNLESVRTKAEPYLIKKITFHPDNNLINLSNLYRLFKGFKYVEEIDLKYFKSKIITSLECTFLNCVSLKRIKYLNKIRIDYCERIDLVFGNCYNLKEVKFNIPKRTYMTYLKNCNFMFANCRSLKKINLENLVFCKIEDYSEMFQGCSSLEEIKLFKIKDKYKKNIVSIDKLFQGCKKLKYIDFSSFSNLVNLTSFIGVFDGCSSLEEIDLSNLNSNNIDYFSAVFENCCNLKKVNISNIKFSRIFSRVFKNCYNLEEIIANNTEFNDIVYLSKTFSYCMNLKSTNNLIFNNFKSLRDIDNMCEYCLKLEKIFDINKLITDSYSKSLIYYKDVFLRCDSLKPDIISIYNEKYSLKYE